MATLASLLDILFNLLFNVALAARPHSGTNGERNVPGRCQGMRENAIRGLYVAVRTALQREGTP
jgi:hypothetical protein